MRIERSKKTVTYMDRLIENARIEGTMLGYEDHGMLTLSLELKYATCGQGFGHNILDDPVKDKDGRFLRREGHAFGMELIGQILKTVGVSNWEHLKGKNIRADHDSQQVYGIGHILEDRWVYPQLLVDRFFKKEE